MAKPKFDYGKMLEFLALTGNKNLPERCEDAIEFDVHDASESLGFTICLAEVRGERIAWSRDVGGHKMK